MAIPGWLWPDEGDAEPTVGRSDGRDPSSDADHPLDAVEADPSLDDGGTDHSLDGDDIERATGVFETLSDPTRLAVLATLHRRAEPVRYTALREAAAVEDKGRFNYHLRQLDGLVEREGDGYVLTPRGKRLVVRTLRSRPVRRPD